MNSLSAFSVFCAPARLSCSLLQTFAIMISLGPFATATHAATSSSAVGNGSFSFVRLGDLPGGSFHSRARAVSADGSVIVGESVSDSNGVPSCHGAR